MQTAAFSAVYIFTIYVLHIHIYILNSTYRDVSIICCKRLTNWNIVSILNTGNKLHGSLISNNDIIKRIYIVRCVILYRLDCRANDTRYTRTYATCTPHLSRAFFRINSRTESRHCSRFCNVISDRIFRSRVRYAQYAFSRK